MKPQNRKILSYAALLTGAYLGWRILFKKDTPKQAASKIMDAPEAAAKKVEKATKTASKAVKKLVKGSPEAKAHMARLRSMQRKKKKKKSSKKRSK